VTTSEPDVGLTAGSHPIRLVMADDHPVVLEGLASLFQQASDIQLLACCNSGSAVLEAISRHQPDVVLLDIQMPAPNGLAVLRELRRLGSATRVILLTASVQDDDVLEAVRLGIRGLVPKDAVTEKVVECVRIVARGGSCLDPTLVGHAMAKMLTREAGLRDVSRLLTARESRSWSWSPRAGAIATLQNNCS
jgi:DNA-binding NarL/FixJ family response regulator